MESERREANSTFGDGQSAVARNPTRFRTPTVLALLASLLAVAPACRPCAVVDDAWDDRLAREFAELGPGGTPDTGITDHLRLRLSQQAFALATGTLAEMEVFRPVARASAFETSAGVSIVAEGEMTGRLASVAVAEPDAQGRDAIVAIDAVVAIHLDAIDRRGTYATTSAHASVRAPLAFVADGGPPRLVVDLARATVEDVQFDIGPMPEGFADVPPWVVPDVVADMTAALVATVEEPVVLLALPALILGGSPLELAPSSLVADPGDGSVTLGVVTALRPRGAMSPDGPPAPDLGFGFAVHPDLWRAALVYLHAVGRAPRRFDAAGAPTLDGAIGVAVDRADTSPVALGLTTYCSDGRCAVEAASADGRLELVDGAVRATLELRHAVHATAARPVVDASRDVLAALLGPAPLDLPSGATLVLTPTGLDVDAVTVTGETHVDLGGRR